MTIAGASAAPAIILYSYSINLIPYLKIHLNQCLWICPQLFKFLVQPRGFSIVIADFVILLEGIFPLLKRIIYRIPANLLHHHIGSHSHPLQCHHIFALLMPIPVHHTRRLLPSNIRTSRGEPYLHPS